MSTSILPSNEDQIQRDVEAVGSTVLERFEPSKLTVSPLDCDASLLVHLAASLDVSIAGLDEQEARTYLQNAREIKKYIGSVYAVNRAASSIFGNDIEVQPWNKHAGVPGTFKIFVDVSTKPVTSENLNKTINLITQAKPVSAHLSGIDMNMKNEGHIYLASSLASSEVLEVKPQGVE